MENFVVAGLLLVVLALVAVLVVLDVKRTTVRRTVEKPKAPRSSESQRAVAFRRKLSFVLRSGPRCGQRVEGEQIGSRRPPRTMRNGRVRQYVTLRLAGGGLRTVPSERTRFSGLAYA